MTSLSTLSMPSESKVLRPDRLCGCLAEGFDENESANRGLLPLIMYPFFGGVDGQQYANRGY